MFGTQNARNTTGDRDPTNCTCIIIQSTFSIFKTYNTNTFILYIHRFSFPVAAAVIIKSEVPGIFPPGGGKPGPSARSPWP